MSNRFAVVGFLDQAPAEEFSSSDWQLHMTLLPSFIHEGHLEQLSDQLDVISSNTNPFTVKTTGDELFGLNQDITVSLIEPNNYLTELHLSIASLVTKLGLVYEYPSFTEHGYNFHVTAQKGQKVPADFDPLINDLSLVDRRADDKTGQKKVVKSFDFI